LHTANANDAPTSYRHTNLFQHLTMKVADGVWHMFGLYADRRSWKQVQDGVPQVLVMLDLFQHPLTKSWDGNHNGLCFS